MAQVEVPADLAARNAQVAELSVAEPLVVKADGAGGSGGRGGGDVLRR